MTNSLSKSLGELTSKKENFMTKDEIRMVMFVADLQAALIALGLQFMAVSQWHQLKPKQALGELGIKTSDSIPNDWAFFNFASLAKIQFDKNYRSVKKVTDLDGEITFFMDGETDD